MITNRQTDRQTDVTKYIITTGSCSTSQVVVGSTLCYHNLKSLVINHPLISHKRISKY